MVTANRAVVNFFADMTYSLNEVFLSVTIGNSTSIEGMNLMFL